MFKNHCYSETIEPISKLVYYRIGDRRNLQVGCIKSVHFSLVVRIKNFVL